MSDLGLQLRQARSINLTSSLRQAIGFLSMPNSQLSNFLEFRARTNPFLELRILPGDAARSKAQAAAPPPPDRSRGSAGLDPGRLPNAAPELVAHVRQQASLALRQDDERRIAEHFMAALEPSGWLGEPLDAIADAAGCSVERAETVLRSLQELEPPGIFARSLEECLALQAVDAQRLDPVMQCVLRNLDLIAQARLREVADRCGSTTEEIAVRLATIRGFDPKPGARFGAHVVMSVAPDLIATRSDAGWLVELRDSMLDAVLVRSPEDVTGGTRLSPAERELLDEARWIQKAAQRRERTMLRVGAEIVRRQEGFLREGPRALHPMRLTDIAGALDVHESTVSRITSGRHIATPRGTIALREFFSARLGDPGGAAAVSTASVREAIRTMIAGEDSIVPLSDQEIAEALEQRGLKVARRTIAKYRKQIGLPGSAARKRARILRQAAVRS